MNRWIIVLVVLLSVAPRARADEASKRAKVQELFATMHMDKMMSQIMDVVMAQVQQVLQTMPGTEDLSPQQRKIRDQFQQRVAALVTQSVGWKAIEGDYTTMYASTFSEEEIDGILAFYKSPVGQTMLDKTPELTSKGMQIAQARMVDLQPQIKAMIDDLMKEVMATMPPPKKAPPKSHVQN